MQQTMHNEFSDLDRGWSWVVLFASFCMNLLLGGVANNIGITFSVLLERYKESIYLTSWVGSLHTSLLFLAAPLSSVVADRYSCRVAVVLSGLFLTGGYLGTAFAQNINTAIFTCGIVAGIGGGLGLTAGTSVLGYNFKRKQNLANGISLSGVGIGVFILAPVMQAAREYYGALGYFITISMMSANIVTCAMLCFPSRLERHSKLERVRQKKQNSQSSTQNECCVLFRVYLMVVKNKGVIIMCLSYFGYSVGSTVVYVYLAQYIMYNGQSGSQAAFLISLTGIISTISRIITGLVANTGKISEVSIYSFTIAIFGVSTLVYPFTSGHYIGHLMYVIFVGLFYGCCHVVTIAIHVKYIGINYVTSAIGLQHFSGGVGGLLGPILAGRLIDAGGTYGQSFIASACCMLISAAIGALLLCVQKAPVLEGHLRVGEDNGQNESKLMDNDVNPTEECDICLQEVH